MVLSRVLTATGATGLLFLSLRGFCQPWEAARAFGVALPENGTPTPYMHVKADRDATFGAMLLVIAKYADARTLRAVMLCSSISPLVDAAIVARHGKSRDTIVHLVTAAYIFGTAWLASSGR